MSPGSPSTTEKPAVLPPDGAVLRVSPRRGQLGWIAVPAFSFLTIGMLVQIIGEGHSLLALVGPLVTGLAAVGYGRLSASGLVLDSRGVKARTVWWTWHWDWTEIDRFELRERGERPRMMVHLRDGGARGVIGFYARTSTDEEKGQALFDALKQRLAREHAKGQGLTVRQSRHQPSMNG